MTLTSKRLYAFVTLILLSSFAFSQIKVTIRGKVTDEKGAPLLGATVFLNNTQGNSTEEDGTYEITGVVPGSYNLTVSYVGYQSQTKFNIIVKSKGNPAFNFTLIESGEELEEVVVSNKNKISKPRETPLSTQSLSAVEIATYPGGNNDVVQVAQTLPGVSPSVGGFRNDLIIRGGAPKNGVLFGRNGSAQHQSFCDSRKCGRSCGIVECFLYQRCNFVNLSIWCAI